jgi:hypothetical protein
VEPESIDRLPLPAGRESVFELLCVVRLLDALHGPSGQIRLLGDGEDLAGIRLPGLPCLYQGWLGGERLSDEELGAPCVSALERHGVVLPRHFDALVIFDKPRAGFHVDAHALREAAKARAERGDFWLFTSEGEMRQALLAAHLERAQPVIRPVGPARGIIGS